MNRRRLFGFLAGTAGLAAVSQVPRAAAASSEGSLQAVSGNVMLGGPGVTLGATEDGHLTVNGSRVAIESKPLAPESFLSVRYVDQSSLGSLFTRQQPNHHSCQCWNCTPSIALPKLSPHPLDPAGEALAGQPLHAGHFGIRLWRPTHGDWKRGVRLKVRVNGLPISQDGLFETIAGEEGRVWAYSSPGRHVCQMCGHDACVTYYEGRVTVEVMIPEGVQLQATMRDLVTA